MKIPDELKQAAETAKSSGQAAMTVRQLLGFYEYARRGSWISEQIRGHLKKLSLVSVPDFEGLHIDATMYLIPEEKAPKPKPAQPEGGEDGAEAAQEVVERSSDPTHQLSRLAAANRSPLSVKPDDRIETAVTHMLANDYSQLPVMQSKHEVKGVISWKSIGSKINLGNDCESVRDCMDPHKELKSNASMFDAIRLLAEHDCVLVRSETDNSMTGIVTAADISEQFRVLAEPFLLLGDIENMLRRIIEKRFSVEELQSAKADGDSERVVESAANLTFGEYLRLLERPEHWDRLELPLDRKVFLKQLDQVRIVRNNVMHFDPDGIAENELHELRNCSRFLGKVFA